jgi:hypothetical protein
MRAEDGSLSGLFQHCRARIRRRRRVAARGRRRWPGRGRPVGPGGRRLLGTLPHLLGVDADTGQALLDSLDQVTATLAPRPYGRAKPTKYNLEANSLYAEEAKPTGMAATT